MTNSSLSAKPRKAQISPVPIGPLTIEGLLGDDGKFYVGLPQITDNFSVPQKNAARDIKALMGEDFSFLKIKTPLNSKGVNAIPLEQFEVLLAKLDRSGNVKAQEFRDTLAGLSLHQLFCDAFGIEFQKSDRQKWLEARMAGKEVRRTLTDAVQDYIARHPELSEKQIEFMYSNVSELVNLTVFGRKAKKLAEDLKTDRHAIRDSFTRPEVRWISQVEDLAMRLIDQQDMSPCDAVREAKQRLMIPVVGRKAEA